MTSGLRAVVLGSGMAGRGHTIALRRAGVDVVGMASRTESACHAAAQSLGIGRSGSDWRAMIRALEPDIVAVATPAATHVAMCRIALDAGCHVFCEKPLALTASQARELWAAACANGAKTAYAEAYRYQVHLLWARELIGRGVIGTLRRVECVSHNDWPRLMPFGWPHRLDQGGGRLNNHFTHTLSMIQHAVGGDIVAVMGEARNDLRRAPRGEPVHHFGEYKTRALTPQEAATAEWADVDSDWSYTATVRFDTSGREADEVSAWFRHDGMATAKSPDYMAFFGDDGTIHVDGGYADGPLYVSTATGWDEMPLPRALSERVRAEPSAMQRNWDHLARLFVADIAGQPVEEYQTFRDGWIIQEVIDLVRSGRSAVGLRFPTVPPD